MFRRMGNVAAWVLVGSISSILLACGGGGSDGASSPEVVYGDSDLDQAKKMFADLRASVMSVTNESNTGTVDKQSAALKDDFQSGVDVEYVFKGLYEVMEAYKINYQGLSGVADHCGAADASGLVSCTFPANGTNKEYVVTIKGSVGASQASWVVTNVRNQVTGESTALSGLTGTVSASGNLFRMTGSFFPMTGDATKTTVDVTVSESGEKGQQSWTGSGALTAIKSDGVTPSLSANITEASASQVTEEGKLLGSLVGPRHRFDGAIVFNGKLTSSDGQRSSPANGSATGTFTDVSDPSKPFKFLEGTLSYSEGWSGYDYRLPESDTNYSKFSIGFDGTSYKSAGVIGIGLSLSANNTAGYKQINGSFSVKNNSGMFVSGTVTPAQNGEYDTMITNGKGIKATYSSAARTGSVTKGSTILGSVSSQRVTFSDGTFESLI